MRVVWLQDYNFLAQMAGGAELSDREVYLYGLKTGHEMHLINPQTVKMLPEAADLIVVSNATGFNYPGLVKMLAGTPYVMYIHDYFPLCKYRLFFPMLEKCKQCKNLDNAKQLVLNSVLNVFLSPLHFKAWCHAVPELKNHPHHEHPSPVDLELFKPVRGIKVGGKVVKVERKPKAGVVVNAAAFKGGMNTVEYCKSHPDVTFTFIGSRPQHLQNGQIQDIPLPPNCAHVGSVPVHKMPGMFQQASYYVELPDTPQPYNRTALEARLMGVPHLILNKNIGALSYPWFKKDLETIRKNIKNAVPAWWKKVEEAAG